MVAVVRLCGSGAVERAAYFEEYEKKLGVAMEFLLLAVFFVISFVLFTLGGARLIM